MTSSFAMRCQNSGIALALHDRPDDGHAGDSGNIGHDMMQLQVHLRQCLLHVLDVCRRIIQQPLPLSEVGTQTGDFGLGTEAGTQQAVFVEALQPSCVADVGLAAWNVLRVPGVDHHHLEAPLFQDFEYRNPVNTSRFHNDRLYPARGEPVRQPVKIVSKGPERSNRLTVAVRANGCDVYRGADIDRRRSRIGLGQVSRFTRTLRLRHAINPPA
jgi:hypothetical protein